MAALRRDILGLFVAMPGSALTGGCGVTVTVYLVRHAEKGLAAPSGDPKDPPLSELGRRRAQSLVEALAGVTLGAVYATQFKRTQETVEPAAVTRSLTVQVVDAGDVEGQVSRIREHAGGAVLVAGHSNTVPAIATALGASEALVIGEGDYGDLFVVECVGRTVTVSRRRFEAS